MEIIVYTDWVITYNMIMLKVILPCPTDSSETFVSTRPVAMSENAQWRSSEQLRRKSPVAWRLRPVTAASWARTTCEQDALCVSQMRIVASGEEVNTTSWKGKKWRKKNLNLRFSTYQQWQIIEFTCSNKETNTVRAEIFAVVLFSRISRVKPSRKFPLQFMSIYSNDNIS